MYTETVIVIVNDEWNKLKPDKFFSLHGKAISELRGVAEVWCRTIWLAAQRHMRAHPAFNPSHI